MDNAEENCEKRWKIQRKNKLNSEKIGKVGGGGGGGKLCKKCNY